VQSSRELVFANVVASEDLSTLVDYEWCLGHSPNGACDIMSPRAASPDLLLPDVVSLGKGSLLLQPGTNVSVRARVRNSVQVWSLPVWSDVTR
jgi:hypothetical protein